MKHNSITWQFIWSVLQQMYWETKKIVYTIWEKKYKITKLFDQLCIKFLWDISPHTSYVNITMILLFHVTLRNEFVRKSPNQQQFPHIQTSRAEWEAAQMSDLPHSSSRDYGCRSSADSHMKGIEGDCRGHVTPMPRTPAPKIQHTQNTPALSSTPTMFL